MCWRPNSAAPYPVVATYCAPQNLLAGFEGAASRRRREKRCERNGERERKERGRKSRRDEREKAGVNGR